MCKSHKHHCHSRPSDTTVSRGEGNPGWRDFADPTSWVPFPRRVLRTLAGDDKLRIWRCCVTLAAALTPPALADMSTDPETVVVTATRTPQPLELTGTSMSVITADDLKIQQTDVVTDILAETPGLMVNRAGGVGQPTSISLRGAETGQTVVLIDGVRINDPSATDEGAILGDVLVNNIDRDRGAARAAIDALWQRRDRRRGEHPHQARRRHAVRAAPRCAEGGSFDTWHLNAATNGTADNVEYGAALNWFDTGGISAADSRNGNPETDGYSNFGATFNTRTHFGAGLERRPARLLHPRP